MQVQVLTLTTGHFRIALETTRTVAHGEVVHHLTDGVEPTRPRARILTLLVDALQVEWTVGVDGALRSALDVWVTEVLGWTSAFVAGGAHN